MALSRATFQYNAHICHSICLIRPESEPYPNKFAALSPYDPYTTEHYREPTQGKCRKTVGKAAEA